MALTQLNQKQKQKLNVGLFILFYWSAELTKLFLPHPPNGAL